VATGHYARLGRDEASGRHLLKRSLDANKDQSYFLFSLTQGQLARALFPLGDRPKEAVREYARRRGLPVADKPDSQEICFIPDHDYAAFVSARLPDAGGGTIVDTAGRVLGRHDGVHRFTVGQRKGLGLSGATDGRPVYVLSLHAAEQQVVVGPRSLLERTTLTASNVNWIASEPSAPLRVTAQIRHRHRAADASVRSLGGGRAEIVFDAPQTAITPGQAAVFYQADVVVGGGWID
jgi:tRNA-specific 2-thiouridylase